MRSNSARCLVTGGVGFIVSHLKQIAKSILPKFIIRTISTHIYRNHNTPSKYKGLRYPAARGCAIVDEAQQHFEKLVTVSKTHEIHLGDRWATYTDRMRKAIMGLKHADDVILYGQSQCGFDHRHRSVNWQPYLTLYEDRLKYEFPHFSSVIDQLGDSPYSNPETLLKYRGRLVSNIFFYHLRYVLQCLTYIKEPNIICEIGGGYGDTARLWLQNPIFRPSCYIIIDLPESLFFAEVFLRVNFDDLKLLYVTNSTKLSSEVVSQYDVILCPIAFVSAISGLSLDSVINTGSLGEMPNEWVDFWMQWLREQDCQWFYSLNYFAQPLDNLQDGESLYSLLLPSNWVTRLQVFNPAFVMLQAPRNFAEILAQKQASAPTTSKEKLSFRYQLTKDKVLDCQTLLEAMDIVRLDEDGDIMWDLLVRCITEMPRIPKEAYYLAEYLAKHASPAFITRNGEQLQKLRKRLDFVYSSGRED